MTTQTQAQIDKKSLELKKLKAKLRQEQQKLLQKKQQEEAQVKIFVADIFLDWRRGGYQTDVQAVVDKVEKKLLDTGYLNADF